MSHQEFKTIALVVAVFGAAALVGISPMLVMNAEAKITCQTPSGNEPTGQQDRDKCRGEGLTFKNPSNHAPPGWNK